MPPKRPPPLVPKKPNPSMNYEVLIYLNSFYFGMFACCEMAMGLLKAINLSYTGHSLAQDSAVMISFIVLETLRLIMGRKGTLAERGWTAILSVFLTAPCFLGVSYLLLLQTYKLRLEYCLGTLQIALYLTEVWYAIVFVFSLCRPVTYD
ncbi:hypothetical protein KR215_006101 [Drosophila sulfurigaster]|uniref:Transmembrane protein 216 n=1 Tax=Drosophila albomicans TaxID=7291 RepID=A0A6P8XLL7_DROAB|nr:transmembrane protein 216 [Drosophila albomicans]XP_060645842.1 transmembrane protein 216 [Drosophila nasuta]XP_062121695.1 transmembrane protein 216 [Drosophila sulfurigaster albostrigata]KAH8406534.1 hypothetical protein KR215_006101 [Drosophila sulfurigaster]